MADNLKQKLSDELRDSMRKGDKLRVSVIRMLLASVKNAEIEKRGELTEPEMLGVVGREVKKRNESIEAFSRGNRPELVEREEAELAILKGYMPTQLSEGEIRAAINEAVSETGAGAMADKGRLMSVLMPRMKGRADGKLVNELVNQILST